MVQKFRVDVENGLEFIFIGGRVDRSELIWCGSDDVSEFNTFGDDAFISDFISFIDDVSTSEFISFIDEAVSEFIDDTDVFSINGIIGGADDLEHNIF